MGLRPLNNVVIIEMDPIEKYQGMIAIPDDNPLEKISPFGTIQRVGPKCTSNIKEGDRVVIDKFFDRPFWVEDEGKKLRLVYEHYIHGIVK